MPKITELVATGNGCVKVTLDDGRAVVLATRGKTPVERRENRDAVTAALTDAFAKLDELGYSK